MFTVYGISTCDSCKKARAWLTAHNLIHTFVDLRATPPTEDRVQRWVRVLGDKALRNTSGQSYRALGDKKEGMDTAAWSHAFLKDPMLIKRPVLERNNIPIAVGFSPQRYTELVVPS